MLRVLWIRAVAYAVYSIIIWFVAFWVNHQWFPDVVGVYELERIAFVCVVGALSTFVSTAICRRLEIIGFADYCLSIIGRTGVPLAIFVWRSAFLSEQSMRLLAYTMLVVYFLTAPVLLWLTTLSSKEFQRLYNGAIGK